VSIIKVQDRLEQQAYHDRDRGKVIVEAFLGQGQGQGQGVGIGDDHIPVTADQDQDRERDLVGLDHREAIRDPRHTLRDPGQDDAVEGEEDRQVTRPQALVTSTV